MLSPPAPTPQKEREREQSWLEPLITSEGLVSLLGRYAYELATPAPSKSMPLDRRYSTRLYLSSCTHAQSSEIHAIHRSLSALLYHINSRVLRPTPIYVERHVEPVWMSTLDAILALDRKLSAEAVNMASLWYKFGTDLGLSEFDLRLKAAKKAVLGERNLIGCSWHRCVLHRQMSSIGRLMWIEKTGCGRVQYCSSKFSMLQISTTYNFVYFIAFCQTRLVSGIVGFNPVWILILAFRHWNEGGHRDVCSPCRAIVPT